MPLLKVDTQKTFTPSSNDFSRLENMFNYTVKSDNIVLLTLRKEVPKSELLLYSIFDGGYTAFRYEKFGDKRDEENLYYISPDSGKYIERSSCYRERKITCLYKKHVS